MLTALRKDGLIGNPPNFKVDSDVEDAKGAIAAGQREKQAEAARVKAEEPPKVEPPKAEPPKVPQKKRGACAGNIRISDIVLYHMSARHGQCCHLIAVSSTAIL